MDEKAISAVKSGLSAYLIIMMFEAMLSKGVPEPEKYLKERIDVETNKFIESLQTAGFSIVKVESIPEAFLK